MARTLIDTGDEDQVRAAEKKGGLKRLQDDEDVISVLRESGGRRFLRRVLSECGLYADHPTTPTLERFMGRRQVGLAIRSMIELAEPGAFERLQAEGNDGD